MEYMIGYQVFALIYHFNWPSIWLGQVSGFVLPIIYLKYSDSQTPEQTV